MALRIIFSKTKNPCVVCVCTNLQVCIVFRFDRRRWTDYKQTHKYIYNWKWEYFLLTALLTRILKILSFKVRFYNSLSWELIYSGILCDPKFNSWGDVSAPLISYPHPLFLKLGWNISSPGIPSSLLGNFYYCSTLSPTTIAQYLLSLCTIILT